MPALTIESLRARLSACELESAALAKEALSPSTSAERRSQALILRASMQSWSVSLGRDLQRLESQQKRPFVERRLRFATPDLNAGDHNAQAEPRSEAAWEIPAYIFQK